MAKTIVLFHGNLNTLNLFTDQMREGFEALGYDIFHFDLEQSMQSLGSLYALMQKQPVVAMIGFNSTFFGLRTDSGVKVWEQLNIPCINILVDHPYWYRDILLKSPANSVILCVDRNHMSFVNRFYPQIEMNGFLAHGGTFAKRELKLIKDRRIDVLYAGSLYTDYAAIQKPDFTRWDFPAEKICEEAVAYLKEDRQITIEQALEECLIRSRVRLNEEELCEFISSCVFIERVVSSHFREKIVETVAKSGISLALYGSGWEKCDWLSLPNVHYGGMISPEGVLDKMEDTKIVLNTFPWFKDGSHERIFNGMLRKCVIASDISAYLEEILPRDVWCGFSLSDQEIDALPQRLQMLLVDTEGMQRMADAGYEIAASEHTWQMRAQEIHEGILTYL